MTRTRNRPGEATRAAIKVKGTTTCSQSTHAADVYAWSAVYLGDGRVVSLAWLRGWPGAVSARWSR